MSVSALCFNSIQENTERYVLLEDGVTMVTHADKLIATVNGHVSFYFGGVNYSGFFG